jgi:hypothetical protein
LISLLSLPTISAGVFFGRADSEPCRRLIAGHELPYGRDVWKQFSTRSRRHRQRAEFTAPYEVERRRYRTERYLYLSAKQIREEAATIVHRNQIDTR